MHQSFSCRRLRPFFCNLGNSSTRSIIVSPASDSFTSIISNIKRLGRKAQYLEIFKLVDNLPLDAILEAAITESRTKRNITNSQNRNNVTHISEAFPFIFDALLSAKSEKVLLMIEFTKKNVSVADQIGSKKLFDACSMLHRVENDLSSENESIGKAASPPRDAKQIYFSSRRIIEHMFIPHYTQWLLAMDSAQRNHHTVNLLCHQHEMLDRSFYFTIQLEYIRSLANGSASQIEDTSNAYSTSFGDVVISGFTAARMFNRPDIAIRRLKISFPEPENFSKEGFSLAVTGCVTGKTYESELKSSNFTVTKTLLDALSLVCHGNSFYCIQLRDILLQVLQSRGCSKLVIDYATKYKSEGLLLGSRGWNILIAAHIYDRDFESAKAVLLNHHFEEDFVRNVGPKVFSDKPSEDTFKIHEESILQRKGPQSSTHGDIGGHRGMGRKSSYNSDGEFVEDIYSFRRKKYNNLIVECVNREASYNSKFVHSDKGVRKLRENVNQNPTTIAFNQEFDLLLQNNKHEIPEFGVNLHTFTSLIFSPFLNIESRNYYAPNKNVRFCCALFIPEQISYLDWNELSLTTSTNQVFHLQKGHSLIHCFVSTTSLAHEN